MHFSQLVQAIGQLHRVSKMHRPDTTPLTDAILFAVDLNYDVQNPVSWWVKINYQPVDIFVLFG